MVEDSVFVFRAILNSLFEELKPNLLPDKFRYMIILGLVLLMTELCGRYCQHKIWTIFGKPFGSISIVI